MCGIYGIVGDFSVSLLAAMGRSLSHRGPDEEGCYRGQGAGLGIRRLSIIDPAGGQQPVSNEDGTLHAVFNGEIYNHNALRQSLKAQGHRFQSLSDTEVIVHAYEEYGPSCCRLFEGMFAFAIWDERRRELCLGRDRVGEKPLYYRQDETHLFFGSEIKAILQDPDYSRRLNANALVNYLARLYVPGEDTLFQGIRRLEPGHYLTFRDGHTEQVRYWNLQFAPKEKKSEKVLAATLRELLAASVLLRLAPSGPTGLFLSGGVDSSLLLALAVEAGADMRTYAMGFEAQGHDVLDERQVASQVAQHFGVPHADIVITGRQVRDMLPRILWHFDEPFSGAVPQYFLSQRVAADTKVVLSGLGGDELFGNYGRRFRLEKALGYWGWIWDYWPKAWKPQSAVASTYAEWYGAFNSAARHDLLAPEFAREVADKPTMTSLLNRYLSESDAALLGDQVFLMDFKTQLVSEYLNYSDVLSMAWGLECRVPFLSYPLIEFAARLPPNLRNRVGQEKYLLRKACEGLLPSDIFRRKKAGFSLPYASWLRAELKEMTLDYLSPDRLMSQGYFRPDHVQRLLKGFYQENRQDVTYQIWALLCFEIWDEVVFRSGLEASQPAGVYA